MKEKNRHLEAFSQIKWGEKFGALGRGLQVFAQSFYYGFKSKTVPVIDLLFVSSLIGIIILFHVDRWCFTKMQLAFFYPKNVWLYWFYRLFWLSSPFTLWGTIQAILSSDLRKKLSPHLYTSNLQNRLGKLPDFVSDNPINSSTRTLKLTKVGLPLKTFNENKDRLASALQVTIDQVIDNNEQGTVDIVYGFGDMPKIFPLIDRVKTVGPDFFVIGKTRAGEIKYSFTEIPHWLIAGQSIGGKSTFINQALTTLYINNPGYQFLCIDLKGGVEFEVFQNTKRITVVGDIKRTIEELEQIPLMFEERMALLKKHNCKDTEAYESLVKDKKKAGKTLSPLGRYVIAVDEVAELFLTSGKATGTEIQKTRGILSQVTRQGRALGVHALLSTQRPDSRALDTQVKANLPGVICYQLPNDASSIVVLGNGRATDITNNKGRAIFKRGPDFVEIQTPILYAEEINALLKDSRIDSVPKSPVPQSPIQETAPGRD